MALSIGASSASAQTTPQPIPALLPDKTTIRAGGPMPIDGMWRIDVAHARVRIEGGRMYALDPWVHLFAFRIMPGMVVVRNIVRQGPGHYTGDDLPNLGPMTAKLNDNQQLEVHIQGTLAPIDIVLTSLQPDDPRGFRREREDQLSAEQSAQR
jgi:hypothetical protein